MLILNFWMSNRQKLDGSPEALARGLTGQRINSRVKEQIIFHRVSDNLSLSMFYFNEWTERITASNV